MHVPSLCYVLVLQCINGLETGSSWYKSKGLAFECTGCGECCTVEGEVWFDKDEATQLNAEEKKGLDALILPSGHRRSRRSAEKCYYLNEENRCSIHNVRPQQCAAYPFWPRILKSEQNWQQEPCEGIVHDKEDVKIVSSEEIDEAAAKWAAWLRRFPLKAVTALKATEKWIQLIAEIGLCPWAQSAIDQGACRFVIASSLLDIRETLKIVLTELHEEYSPSHEPIVFLVFLFSNDTNFSSFYSMLDDLEEFALQDNAQIAGFHPEWLYAGLDPKDPLHFEKRSPFPTISVVRESALKNAQHVTTRIADDNLRILSGFDYDDLQTRFSRLLLSSSSSSA